MKHLLGIALITIATSCGEATNQNVLVASNQVHDTIVEEVHPVKKKANLPEDATYGSIEYYLSNSLNYAPYINLSFSLPELLEQLKTDPSFKKNVKQKFESVDKELTYTKEYPTVKKQVQFFKSQVNQAEGYENEKEHILNTLPTVTPNPTNLDTYSKLFKALAAADGAGHWEIANTLYTLLIIDGDIVLSVKDKDSKTAKGYQEFIDNLEDYCFVAMASDNVPKEIIERKRNYLLGKISEEKYPEFYSKLKEAKIRVID